MRSTTRDVWAIRPAASHVSVYVQSELTPSGCRKTIVATVSSPRVFMMAFSSDRLAHVHVHLGCTNMTSIFSPSARSRRDAVGQTSGATSCVPGVDWKTNTCVTPTPTRMAHIATPAATATQARH